MAKRFGRNQRRHMREEIAKKDQMLATSRSEAAALRHRLTEWSTEILHLLGSDSAFNEQLRRIRNEGLLDRLQLSPIPAPVFMRDRAPQWERVSDVITACIMRCQIRSDDLRGQIAVEIGDHMGQLVAYAISEDRRQAWTPRDIRYMAEMIANEMANHLARRMAAA